MVGIVGAGRIIIETCNRVLDRTYCTLHPDASPGEYVMLSVSDTGCGVGMQNNGFIHPYSELGEGSTFRIYLPRHVDGAPAQETLALTVRRALDW